MKSPLRFLLLLILCSVGLVFAQPSRTVSKTFPITKDGSFSLDTYKGSYDIQAWDKAEVSIEARVVADDSWGDDDEKAVELVDIEFDASATSVSVHTSYRRLERERRGWKFWDSMSMSLPDVHYTIRVPSTVRLRVEDYKSERCTIAGMSSDLSFETYKGSVTIKDFSGSLRGETYKGEVEVQYARYTRDARFETYKGDLTIQLPSSSSLSLRASLGDRADFDSDFRVDDERTSRRKRSDRRLTADVNGGGPELSFNSDKGSIRLRSR